MERHNHNIIYIYGLTGILSAMALGIALPVAFSRTEIVAFLLTLITIIFFFLLIHRAARFAKEAYAKTEALEKNNALLARTNKELEQFAYIASHDLKAPLRHIDNLAQWVIEDTQGLLPQDAEEKLHMLRDRVVRLDRLLNDILTYSRAGRIIGEETKIDLAELLTELSETHLPENFDLHILTPLPTLQAARTPLEQIWGNIFSNAVKHHHKDKGHITVSVQDKGNFYEFIAHDDGPGIPPIQHERVFEMFQTLQSKDKTEGCGLGLAIIRKLIDHQGGDVWIESGPEGQGTAIHFLWPKIMNS